MYFSFLIHPYPVNSIDSVVKQITKKCEMKVGLSLFVELEDLFVELTKARHYTLNNISHSTIVCPHTGVLIST